MSPAKITALLSSLTLGAMLLAATPAPVPPPPTGNDVFLKVDGCQGSSTATGYTGWMEMDSFQLSVANGMQPGATSGTRRLLPVFGNLSVSATCIPNLPELAAKCAMGTVIKNVTLNVRNLTSGISGPLMKLELKDAVIAKVSSVLAADGSIRQVVEIAYASIEMTTKDSTGRQRKMTWNVAKNAVR